MNKNEQGEEGRRPSMCVRSYFKKMLRFSKWSFIVILQFFLLIIIAVWNIKQNIMKDDNIQSCHWMACDRFREPLLLCTTFCSFLCTIHYFFAHFEQKWLLIFIGYRCTSWSVVKCTNVVNLIWRQNEKNFAFSLIFPSFGPSNKYDR